MMKVGNCYFLKKYQTLLYTSHKCGDEMVVDHIYNKDVRGHWVDDNELIQCKTHEFSKIFTSKEN